MPHLSWQSYSCSLILLFLLSTRKHSVSCVPQCWQVLQSIRYHILHGFRFGNFHCLTPSETYSIEFYIAKFLVEPSYMILSQRPFLPQAVSCAVNQKKLLNTSYINVNWSWQFSRLYGTSTFLKLHFRPRSFTTLCSVYGSPLRYTQASLSLLLPL